MKITSNLLDEFRKDFDAQMKTLEAKYGVAVKLGSMRYDANQFTSKVTVTNTAGGLSSEEAEGKLSLKRDGWKFGLTEADYNKKITFLEEVYHIKGIAPRSRKYPILALRSDGASYKLPGYSVNKK